jgi:hypothetical protein
MTMQATRTGHYGFSHSVHMEWIKLRSLRARRVTARLVKGGFTKVVVIKKTPGVIGALGVFRPFRSGGQGRGGTADPPLSFRERSEHHHAEAMLRVRPAN